LSDPSGQVNLLWLDVSSETLISVPKGFLDSYNYNSIIIGVICAFIGTIIIIGIIVNFIIRDPNKTVKQLPKAIKKHYLQFSRSPINWEQKGKNASISFLKLLEPNEKAFEKKKNGWRRNSN